MSLLFSVFGSFDRPQRVERREATPAADRGASRGRLHRGVHRPAERQRLRKLPALRLPPRILARGSSELTGNHNLWPLPATGQAINKSYIISFLNKD